MPLFAFVCSIHVGGSSFCLGLALLLAILLYQFQHTLCVLCPSSGQKFHTTDIFIGELCPFFFYVLLYKISQLYDLQYVCLTCICLNHWFCMYYTCL